MNTNDAARLARDLMNQHGLTGWYFQFDRAKTRFGQCSHSRRRISLSEPLVLVNDEHQVRDTILHEIAHALAGPHAGHGPAWRTVCRQIGADPSRCVDSATIATPPAPYVVVCENCGPVAPRHKRPRPGQKWRHNCGGEATWRPNTDRWTPQDGEKVAARQVAQPPVKLDDAARERARQRAAARSAEISRRLGL